MRRLRVERILRAARPALACALLLSLAANAWSKGKRMTEPEGIVCTMELGPSGLPQRGPAVIERERRRFGQVRGWVGVGGKGAPVELPPLTTAELMRGLVARGPMPSGAAFLIGRCRAADQAADQRLTRRLIEVARDESGDLAIEAAMSLALRGQIAAGRKVLEKAVRGKDRAANLAQAAAYLAQLGDPAGYPLVVEELHRDIGTARVLALRTLSAFRPFDGQKVKGKLVDVRALLVERLTDKEAVVRFEVPEVMREVGVPDLPALLAPLAEGDNDEQVRAAAKRAIDAGATAH